MHRRLSVIDRWWLSIGFWCPINRAATVVPGTLSWIYLSRLLDTLRKIVEEPSLLLSCLFVYLFVCLFVCFKSTRFKVLVRLMSHRLRLVRSFQSTNFTDSLLLFALSAGAMIRRASVDDRRRASVGGTSVSFLRQDHSFDPSHAAILFRDSRGVNITKSIIQSIISTLPMFQPYKTLIEHNFINTFE